jgi:hypothetical protein
MLEMSMTEVVQAATKDLLRDIAQQAKQSAQNSPASKVLREAAAEVLTGHATWTEAIRVSAYREALLESAEQIRRGPVRIDAELLAHCEDAGRAHLDAYAREKGIVITDRPALLFDSPPRPES